MSKFYRKRKGLSSPMSTTSSVNQVLLDTKQLVSTGRNKPKPTDINWYENDHLFNQLPDLVNLQLKAWYCKMFYLLGKDRVLELASQARSDGSDSRKLFSHLLKKSCA